MDRQSVSVQIDRRPEDVFAYMDDISSEHEWQPNLKSAAKDPPGETRVGTRKRYVSTFMGREVENTYEVTRLEPGRRIVYQTTRDSAIEATSEVVCEQEGTATRVTLHLDGKPRGALRFMPRKALELVYREELETTLDRLKARLEARPGG